MVTEDGEQDRLKRGGPLSDELLGHHGSDTLLGAGGHDVIWGDWDPVRNNTRQRDLLDGGPGNDWLYPSHGRSVVKGRARDRLRLGLLRQGHDRLRAGHRHRPDPHHRRLHDPHLRAHPPLLRARRERRRPVPLADRQAGAVGGPAGARAAIGAQTRSRI